MEQRCFWGYSQEIIRGEGSIKFSPTSQPHYSKYLVGKCLTMKLDEQLIREEILWKQKSREAWSSSSDLNTKFFHASTVIRRYRNQITELKNKGGDWISGRSDFGRELVNLRSSIISPTAPPSLTT